MNPPTKTPKSWDADNDPGTRLVPKPKNLPKPKAVTKPVKKVRRK